MKITLITVCKNEADILPFFFRHYEPFVDQFVFFDNESTDDTSRIIAERDDSLRIAYNSLGFLKEEVLTMIRSHAYQNLALDSDWFLIVDTDEFLWHPDMRSYLEACLAKGITLPRVKGYNMYSSETPEDDGNNLLTDSIRTGIANHMFDKHAVVHRSVSVNYGWGSHRCNPRGNIKYSDQSDILLLHYRRSYIGKEKPLREYRLARNKRFTPRTVELCGMNQSGRSRGIRVITTEEGQRYAVGVFPEEQKQQLDATFAAASHGDPEAQHRMGLCHFYGHGTPIDYVNAAKWSLEAAKGENKFAQYHTGFAFLYAVGVEKNMTEAIRWLRQAAEQGHAHAQKELGLLMLDSYPSTPLEETQKWLKAAAEQGLGETAACLERICRRPDYGISNLEEANHWRRVAAENNHTLSMFNEGVECYNSKQFEDAFYWFLQAYDRGLKDAETMLKKMFELGLGAPQDLAGSIEWFKIKILFAVGDF